MAGPDDPQPVEAGCFLLIRQDVDFVVIAEDRLRSYLPALVDFGRPEAESHFRRDQESVVQDGGAGLDLPGNAVAAEDPDLGPCVFHVFLQVSGNRTDGIPAVYVFHPADGRVEMVIFRMVLVCLAQRPTSS